MKLSDIEKKQPFQSPKGYLENFKPKLQQAQDKPFMAVRYSLAAACAVVVVLIGLFFVLPPNQQNDIEWDELPGTVYSFEMLTHPSPSLAIIEQMYDMDLLPDLEQLID